MRPGIKFQNGEQFDAEAGENTLERHLSGRVTGFTLLANGVLRLQDVRPKQ
jgi:ABC-type transport system substrate-binding protein